MAATHQPTDSVDTNYGSDKDATTPAFPSLTPLSHDLPLLSPTTAPTFSPDEFLLSRTKAADLNYILSDLRSYSEKLKDELYLIINEDYKDFVSLGSSLKAEAHRIARLGWNNRPLHETGEHHVEAQGLMAPVRDTLLASREMLKSVQDDIADCIRRREDAGSHKSRLELMLQLHDSIARLEDLLLIQDDKARRKSVSGKRRPSVLSLTSRPERRGSLASVGSTASDAEGSDYAMSSGYDSSDSEDEAPSSTKRTRRKPARRLSPSAHHARTPSLVKQPAEPRNRSDTVSGPAPSSSSLLGLPQRIARTSAEYSRLRFLHRRLSEENLAQFTDALADRIDAIRAVLRTDLRTLLRSLLSPTSLLVHGPTSARLPSSPELRKARPSVSMGTRRTSFLQSLANKPVAIAENEGSELDGWSQVAEPVEGGSEVERGYWEARLDEQRGWLEMVLSALNTLRLMREVGEVEGEEGVTTTTTRKNEAEEAVRDLLVADWAEKHITLSTEGLSGADTTKDLPEAVRALFKEHQTEVQSLLLPSAPGAEKIQLVSVYNAILHFTSTTAYHLIEAAKEVSLTPTSTTEPTASSACDIFANVIWDTFSTHLLTTLGSTIFFVGQPDTFFHNFTLTNRFLSTLLSLSPTPDSKRAVEASDNWLAFKRRWQLPVYFQMRFREVVTALEAQLAHGTEKEEEGKSKALMKGTRATVEAVQRVWSEGVHIHELSAREWRVTLQILSRFKTWVEQQAPPELVAAGTGSRERMESQGRGSMDRTPEFSRVGTPQPPTDAGSQQHEDELLAFAGELLWNCLQLQDLVRAMVDSLILPRVTAGVDEGVDSLRADLVGVLDEETLDFVPGMVSAVGRYALSIITPRCAAPLRLLRSFSTPAYRPNSNSGSNASPAVQVIGQLFQPLETFLTLPAIEHLPQIQKRAWTEAILTDTFKRYTTTIETINKNQASLIRLKKSQSGGGGILGGLFKGSNAPSAADAEEKSITDSNKQALTVFKDKINGLHLAIDLDSFDAWLRLKDFLESEVE